VAGDVLGKLAVRLLGAQARFLVWAQETAGLSPAEAERALVEMRRARVLSFGVDGQFSLKHGAFADPAVLRRAAGRKA
jgi:hypothetical protein